MGVQYLVDLASTICLSQRLSHASVRKRSHSLFCVDLDICGMLIKRVFYLAIGMIACYYKDNAVNCRDNT
jgi:hypothetical protein